MATQRRGAPSPAILPGGGEDGRSPTEKTGGGGARRAAPASRRRPTANGAGRSSRRGSGGRKPRTPPRLSRDRRMVEVEGPTRGTRGLWRNGTSGWAGSGTSSGGSRRRGDVPGVPTRVPTEGGTTRRRGRIGATIPRRRRGAPCRKSRPRFDRRRRRRGRRRCSSSSSATRSRRRRRRRTGGGRGTRLSDFEWSGNSLSPSLPLSRRPRPRSRRKTTARVDPGSTSRPPISSGTRFETRTPSRPVREPGRAGRGWAVRARRRCRRRRRTRGARGWSARGRRTRRRGVTPRGLSPCASGWRGCGEIESAKAGEKGRPVSVARRIS